MARRLEEATDEALFTGGAAGRRAIEEAGFSEELKEKLLDKVKTAQFQKKYAGAFATAEMSSSSSRPSGAFHPSDPWTGAESQSDAVLRMLDDARKPLKKELRGKYKIPNPVDLRPRATRRVSASQRAADARDKAGMYADMGMKEERGAQDQIDEEREERRRALRERFEPNARAVPATVSGLAALANQRIDEAVARGAFRDIPRGKDAGPRDTRADNPFIDTTEYLMNKMIQRQEIVPPWIEKQQEVAKTANVFRERLRNDWRRHAARMIASKGGGLEEQVRKAEGYAMAEARVNPRRRVAAGAAVSGISTDDPVMVKVRESAVAADLAEAAAAAAVAASAMVTAEPTTPTSSEKDSPGNDPSSNPYAGAPFRDPVWEEAEKAYLTLSIENLNALTRSYNLMAPELAKKPYFSLERELKACYADVAPLVAGTIRERATTPARSMTAGDGESSVRGTVFDRFGNEGGESARVYDNKAPHYGLKEMWRDFWKGDKA